MIREWLQATTVRAGGGAEPEAAGMSRRDLLKGLGALGALAAAGPALLAPSRAEAEIVEAQYYGGPGYRRGRGRGRSRGRRRRGQRLSAREVRWRCHNDWRFRRRNPGLCHRVLAWRPRRSGVCVQIGALTICS